MSGKEVRVDRSELLESIGTVEELRASDHASIHASEESKKVESKSNPDHKSSSEINPVHESSTEKKGDHKEEGKTELKEQKKSDSESSDSSSESGARQVKDEGKVEKKPEHKEEDKVVHVAEHREEKKENTAQVVLPEVKNEAGVEAAAPGGGAVQTLFEKARDYVNENTKFVVGGVTIAALTIAALRFKKRRG